MHRKRCATLMMGVVTLGLFFGSALYAYSAVEAPGASAERPSLFALALKGGIFMIPIAACSVVILTFSLERFLVLRQEEKRLKALLAGLREQMEGRTFSGESGLRLCESYPGTASEILKAGFLKAGRPQAMIEKAVSRAGEAQMTRLRRNLTALTVTTTISPLLGLIGTIQGMIQAFMMVAGAPGGLGKTAMLADGIYTALVTTFAGLCVAIPGTILYYYLAGKIDRLMSAVDESIDPLIDALSENREHVLSRSGDDRGPV